MMRITVAHNYYQQQGGEDASFEAEVALLREQGHYVATYTVHNDAIRAMSPLAVAGKTVWNRDSYRSLDTLLKRGSFDVVHFQNTFPLISPSVYYAAKANSVAVVQSLRNYRLMCVNGLFFRGGQVCEDCLGKPVPWPGVTHACYRDSRAASSVVAAMLTFHRLRSSWTKMVDVLVALTEFSKRKFIEAGLPAEKILVKPNFLNPDPGIGEGRGGFALFVGRLSPEKGIGTLLQAWETIGSRLPLKIVGDGPLVTAVKRASERRADAVSWLGRKAPTEVYALMGEAALLVFPSEWYETFGRVAMEAFAKGTPVVAANIGAIAELVRHGETGLHFRPGDVDDLVAQVEWYLSHPNEHARMRRSARAEFEEKYTAEKNYQQLMNIYEVARQNAAG
jgi:glycosyltransferase involved in cell wall biosynthesis